MIGEILASSNVCICRDVAIREESVEPCPLPTLTSEPNKVQKFQFQTSGILLFTGAQELCRSVLSSLLPFTIFSISTIYGVFLFLLHWVNRSLHVGPFEKGPIVNAGPSEKFLIVYHPKEEHI